MQSSYLTNQFLIAMPGLADPNFHRTVTYICAHNEDGAMGIIINRPLGLMLDEVFEQMEIKTSDRLVGRTPVFHGGPVQADRGFVIHQPVQKWDYSIEVGDDFGIATSRDILNAIAHGNGPEQAFIALGYAGWSAGQLEDEIRDNIWLNAPADSRIVFSAPVEKRWEAAIALTGIDMERLSSNMGHA